jgi:hypothetical protein
MRLIPVAALITVAAALFAPAATAATQAAAPCWQRVIDDWRDGRIDGTYAVHCYRDGLLHLPEDLRVYGSAEADIQRALTRALARSAIHVRRSASATKAGRIAAATSTPAKRSDRRTLASQRPMQSKRLRVAAARAADTTKSSFPVALMLGAAAGLCVAVAALLSLRRLSRRHVRHG